MTRSARFVYEFGPFRLDTGNHLLLREGEVVQLKPKVVDTLLVLVESRGRVIGKDELIERLWPDTIVEESNLSQNIYLLRKALGEGPNEQNYIETVPKRGYRFVAEVREVSEVPTTEIAQAVESGAEASQASEKPKGIEAASAKEEAVWRRNGNLPSLLKARWSAHPRLVVVLFALIGLAAAALFWLNRAPALTDKDTVLLADFVNTTGDAVFDSTLKQALAVQLEQSPFLSIFPEERVRESLRFMERPPDERVTRDLAREICQRQGLKAMLLGSIAKFDRNYAISLEAINAQSGEAIARQQVEAEGKDQVLKALGGAATKLREKLGESLASIRKYDAPIEQATTSSLDALKAFALGKEYWDQGKNLEAISFYQRAVDLDPNFALAWAGLAYAQGSPPLRQGEPAAKAAEKAFELRDRVSEREKLVISEGYYLNVAVNPEKRNEILELWTRTYPRDGTPHFMLGVRYQTFGQYEKAIEEFRETIHLNPNFAHAYGYLARTFIYLDRLDEAREICERALQQKLDSPIRGLLYLLAFIRGDEVEMRQQIDWAAGKPSEFLMLDMQSEVAATSGRLRQAHELSRRAIELAVRRNLLEFASDQTALTAEWSAVLGDCRQVREDIARASTYPHTPIYLFRTSLAHALCGEVRKAQTLSDEMFRQYPRYELVEVLGPLVRAAIEIRRGARAQALQILQSVSLYERASYFIPNYLRGQIYLSEKKGAEAAAEFQKILDHRGWSPTSAMYVPAHLWLARAAVIQGDMAKARKSYQDFFALWTDADPDLPIMIEAKKEYEKVL